MLKENLEKVEENIQAACDRAGRKSGVSGLLDLQHSFGLRGVARAAVGQERVVPQFLGIRPALPRRYGGDFRLA